MILIYIGDECALYHYNDIAICTEINFREQGGEFVFKPVHDSNPNVITTYYIPFSEIKEGEIEVLNSKKPTKSRIC